MFPNDEICNVKAAMGAAKRLFQKYKSNEEQPTGVLGKNEVNRLMKAAYEAINIRIFCWYPAYNPNEEDVFSFIGVFDENKDGQIELKDLEQMAVKYLCGEEALAKIEPPQIKKTYEEPNSINP